MKTYVSKVIRIPQQCRLYVSLSTAINDATARVVTDRHTDRHTQASTVTTLPNLININELLIKLLLALGIHCLRKCSSSGFSGELGNYCDTSLCCMTRILPRVYNIKKHKKDLGMACHTPPLKKVKKQGKMPLPSLGPIPLQNCKM